MTAWGGMQLKASRLAELLWKNRGARLSVLAAGSGSVPGTASDPDSSTPPSNGASRAGSRPTARKARVQLGRDILKDYETVSIGQSAYFTGVSPPPSPSFSHSTQMKRRRNCTMHTKYCALVW